MNTKISPRDISLAEARPRDRGELGQSARGPGRSSGWGGPCRSRSRSPRSIVPNLHRLGLLTPRVRAAYAKLDLLQFEHNKDSVEEPEVTPPQELVEMLMHFLQNTAPVAGAQAVSH